MKHFDFNDEDFGFQHQDVIEYQNKFESMLKNNEFSFMDANQIEDLYQFYWIHSKKDYCNELLEFAIEIHPYHSNFYEYKFNLLYYDEQYLEALEWINYSLLIFPFHYELKLLKGNALRKLEKFDEAIEWYMNLLHENHEKSEIYFYIGISYYAKDDWKSSENCFLMAFQEKNDDIESMIFNLVITTFDFSFSENLVKKYIDLDPFHSESWYYLSQIYFLNRKYDEAIQAIEFAIVINPNQIEYYKQKSEILIQQELFGEALQYLFEALQLQSENENILYNIGVCYQNLELFDDARRYFKKCIDLDDTFFDAYEGLADCLYELERYHEALHFYKTYLENTINLEVSLKYIDLEIELENFAHALDYMKELEELIYDEYLEIEFILRKTYIEYLKGSENITEILKENFYMETHHLETSSKLMYQSAALSFALGAKNTGYFYLENALLKYPENYEYLFDYNPDLMNDTEIQLLIESCK